MKKPKVPSKGRPLTTASSSIPAPIRLVHSFRDAVKASVPYRTLSREALSVELLVIAGIASFDALTRFHDLSRTIDLEGETIPSWTRSDVELGNQGWFETAMTLQGRLHNLKFQGYESESFDLFSQAVRRSSEMESESKERQRLEHRALRTSDLGSLAAKIKPRQKVYDEEGSGD